MKTLIKNILIILTLSLLVSGCGSGSGSGSSDNKQIKGKIDLPSKAVSRAYSDIGDIDQIASILIHDGYADVENVVDVPVKSDGSFNVDIIANDGYKMILLMKSSSELFQQMVSGVIPLTGADETMTSFPIASIEDDIDLGEIKSENDTLISTNSLESNADNFSLEQDLLNQLSRLDDIDKMVINKYINYNKETGVKFEPNITFVPNAVPLENCSNKYSSISDIDYAGYSISVNTNKESFFDKESICDTSTKIQLFPPTTIAINDVNNNVTNLYSPLDPMENDGTYSDPSYEFCGGADFFISNIPYNNTNMVGIGTQIISGKDVSSGYWKLTEDNKVVAAFDLSVGSIIDENTKYKTLVPTFQLQIDENSKFTKFLIKYHLYNKVTNQYEEVTDSDIIRSSIIHISLNFHYPNAPDGQGFEGASLSELDIVKGEVDASAYQNSIYVDGTGDNVASAIYIFIDYSENIGLGVHIDP